MNISLHKFKKLKMKEKYQNRYVLILLFTLLIFPIPASDCHHVDFEFANFTVDLQVSTVTSIIEEDGTEDYLNLDAETKTTEATATTQATAELVTLVVSFSSISKPTETELIDPKFELEQNVANNKTQNNRQEIGIGRKLSLPPTELENNLSDATVYPANDSSLVSSNTSHTIKIIDVDESYTPKGPSFVSSLLEKVPHNNNSEDDYWDTWEPPKYLTTNFPLYLSGFDYEDRPIWIVKYGKFKLRETVENGKDGNLKVYAKYMEYNFIKSIRERNATTGDVNEIALILDFDGLNFYQLSHPPTIVFMLQMVRTYADLVKKHLGLAIVINANFVAETLINLLRPLLGRILEKVEIYGTRSVKWLPVLRRTFPPASIPPWYGGENSNYKPIKFYG